MGTTPNNNFPYPEATGLVKDGWEDIKDLATSIDTKLGVYTGGGLVKLNTTAFSAVSSQSINDVFSTTYDNYKILIHITTSGSSSTFQYRMRVGGADNTASTYNDVNLRASGAAVTTTQNLNQNIGTLAITHSTTITKGISVDLFSPFLTAVTTFNAITGNMDNVNNQIGVYSAGGGHNTASSFTGITIFPSAGTFSGTISIYGYAK